MPEKVTVIVRATPVRVEVKSKTVSVRVKAAQGQGGIDGQDGLSAYQVAVNNGFVGTEQEWLESLQGQNGTNGTDASVTLSNVSAVIVNEQTTPLDASKLSFKDSVTGLLTLVSFANLKVLLASTFAKLTADNNFVGKITANGQGALSALEANDVITRDLMDKALCDPGIIYMRDDFFGGMPSDSANPIGELGWNFIGTGAACRPQTPGTAWGSVALIPAATRRAFASMSFDISNIIGGGGPYFAYLNNASLCYKARISITNLDSHVRAGFASWDNTNALKTSRFFGVRYLKPESVWTATTVITLGDYRKPIVSNGRRYYASIGGTTGATEPIWPTTSGGTVIDGTVTWTEYGLQGNAYIQLVNTPNTANEGGLATIVTTSVLAAINTWYEISARWVSGQIWAFTINGSAEYNLDMGAANSGSSMQPLFAIEAVNTAQPYLQVDYFMLFGRPTYRP